MLYFPTKHTLIIYVQYIKRSKRKTSYLLEKLYEKSLVHFVSDSIFKRLKIDYSSWNTSCICDFERISQEKRLSNGLLLFFKYP